MNEKELIVGKPSKKLQVAFLAVGLVFLLVFFIMYVANVGGCRSIEMVYSGRVWHPSIIDIMIFDYSDFAIVSAVFDIGLIFTLVGLLLYLSLAKMAITVTNKRVYGTATWGKRVDLPLDSISAVSTSAFKGIAVASSSGTIKFKTIDNYEEIHRIISDLLIERQNKEATVTQTTIKQEIPKSNADELAKYKDLMDKGIITKEECFLLPQLVVI